MKYLVRLKTKTENDVFVLEAEEMSCLNCRYSHIEVDGKYHCWGDIESPTISPAGTCEFWKSKYDKKNT